MNSGLLVIALMAALAVLGIARNSRSYDSSASRSWMSDWIHSFWEPKCGIYGDQRKSRQMPVVAVSIFLSKSKEEESAAWDVLAITASLYAHLLIKRYLLSLYENIVRHICDRCRIRSLVFPS